MTTVSLTDAKARLAEYVARAEAGEEILVTKRGVPVARLMPIERLPADDMTRLRELERRGVLRLRTGGWPEGFWDRPRPFVPGNKAIEALLKDREEGR